MYNNQYNPYSYGNSYIPNNYAQNYQNNVQNTSQMQQYAQQLPQKSTILGKMVESVDFAKNNVEVPIDGSLIVLPLLDGSKIVTKKLQTDGTSKVTIYTQEEEKEEIKPQYITREDLKGYLKDFSLDDIEDIKEELKDLKKQIKGLK